MEINLIKDLPHFSRAELPQVLQRLQEILKDWLQGLPKALATRIRARLPKLTVAELTPELLGAIDEDFCLYKDLKDNLVKLQCYLDWHTLPDQEPYPALGGDLGMFLLVHLLQELCWIVRVHQEARRQRFSPQGTQEYVREQFINLAKEQEWLSL